MAGTTVAPVSRRQSKAPIDVFLRGRAGDQVLGVMCEFLGKRFFSKLFIVSMVHFSSVHFSCPAWRGWMMASFITWRYWCWSTSFAILATGDKCQNCMCWYFEGWFLQLTTSSSSNNNNNPFLKEKGAAATTTKKNKKDNYMSTRQQHNITKQWHVLLDLCQNMFMRIANFRSSDFGSPNHRRRCYILGVRSDIGDERTLRKLGHWIQKECASVHTRCTLTQCHLAATALLCVSKKGTLYVLL